MSLRIRGGGASTTPEPEPPPDPTVVYTFPTTTYRYPHFPDDEGHTSHASCSAASGGNPTADGLVCVKDYGAVGNGTTDDTAAIQSAIEQNINENAGIGNRKTIYFPDGTYRLSGLSGNIRGCLERRQTDGEWRAGLRLQGESEAGTILKLDNNVFTNPAAPRFVDLPRVGTGVPDLERPPLPHRRDRARRVQPPGLGLHDQPRCGEHRGHRDQRRDAQLLDLAACHDHRDGFRSRELLDLRLLWYVRGTPGYRAGDVGADHGSRMPVRRPDRGDDVRPLHRAPAVGESGDRRHLC